MHAKRPIKDLLHPRAWPTWSGLLFLYLAIKTLPDKWLEKLGRGLGKLMLVALPRRQSIVSKNLALCFPELSSYEREKLLQETFASLGLSLIDTGLAWWLADAQAEARCQIQGLEYLTQSMQLQRPILLCSCHLMSFEIAGRALSNHFTFNAIYRPQKNQVYNFLMHKRRSQRLAEIIPREDVRSILKALHTNVPLWIAPDQDYGPKRSVFVPFFGVNAATITSVAKLAKLTNALVIPYFSYRHPGLKYLIEFHPPVANFPSDDIQADTTRINEVIEQGIRKAPEQYLWAHRRFKTRPKGEEKLYV